ncbi:hypothetical protein HN587_04695 [Candidatus Woesearchaeota archaeon]|jgi:hypothetical protein|nr:hypothetical protein [Candidatus Woesearchaeota archaeon]
MTTPFDVKRQFYFCIADDQITPDIRRKVIELARYSLQTHDSLEYIGSYADEIISRIPVPKLGKTDASLGEVDPTFAQMSLELVLERETWPILVGAKEEAKQYALEQKADGRLYVTDHDATWVLPNNYIFEVGLFYATIDDHIGQLGIPASPELMAEHMLRLHFKFWADRVEEKVETKVETKVRSKSAYTGS